MLIEKPVLDASWLHPHRSTMETQGARAGYVPIIGARNGLPWSKSNLRPDGRFGYAGYGAANRLTMQRTSARTRGRQHPTTQAKKRGGAYMPDEVLEQANASAWGGYGLVPRWGLQIRTEPNDFTSIYKTPKRRTYRGYSGYGDMDAAEKSIYWGSVGVGMGVFASTLAVSLLVHGSTHKGVTPGWKGAIPAILPSMGAGVLAFLLYRSRDKSCGKGPQIVAGPDVAGETVTHTRMRPTTTAKQQCPEGMAPNPETGVCEYGLI